MILLSVNKDKQYIPCLIEDVSRSFYWHQFPLPQPLRLAFSKRQKGNIQALRRSNVQVLQELPSSPPDHPTEWLIPFACSFNPKCVPKEHHFFLYLLSEQFLSHSHKNQTSSLCRADSSKQISMLIPWKPHYKNLFDD